MSFIIENDILKSYVGQDVEVVIPEEATSIGYRAFHNCASIKWIKLHDNITYIGSNAFEGCSNLINVKLPDKIFSINAQTFKNCSNLIKIILPTKIISISESAFEGCDKLQYAKFNEGLYLGDEINPYLALSKVTNKSISQCTIHQQTRIIAESSFEGCESLNEIKIPNQVVSIGARAFYNCKKLKNLLLDNNSQLHSIGHMAFANCESLSTLAISKSAPTFYVYDRAFSHCLSLTDVIFPDAASLSLHAFSFENCSSLKTVKLSNYISHIGENAFHGCEKLQYNEFDGGLYLGNENNKYLVLMQTKYNKILNNRPIGKLLNLFKKTKKAPTHFSTSEQTRIIYYYAFADYLNLKTVNLSQNIRLIYSNAFHNCTNLTSVSIPNSVITLSSYLFSSCSNLTEVTISNPFSTISSYVFLNCVKLSTVKYNGTLVQWKALRKYNDWDKNTNNYTVVCTDGITAKGGSVSYFK